MTAKEYLSKIQTYRQMMEAYSLRIEELYHEATGIKAIVYDKDRVQVSPENRFEQVMVRIDAEVEKWAKARLRYEDEVRKRTEQIADMDKPLHSELLNLVYIDGLSLRMAAAKMQINHPDKIYSDDYIRRVHGWALAAFDKKYKISGKCHQMSQTYN